MRSPVRSPDGAPASARTATCSAGTSRASRRWRRRTSPELSFDYRIVGLSDHGAAGPPLTPADEEQFGGFRTCRQSIDELQLRLTRHRNRHPDPVVPEHRPRPPMLQIPHAPFEPARIAWLHAVGGALLQHQMMLREKIQDR